MNILRRLATATLCTLILATLAAPHARAVTIDWVTVGNAGNANDTTGYGAVGYEYRIGKYEVTIQQYTDFLNAVDPNGTNPYGLYNSYLETGANVVKGIRFTSGSASGQKYSPIGNAARPIAYVNWFEAARFANWMHNGQGSGSTETGAYTLNGATSGTAPARNPGAKFSMPTESEWYKAAYYSPLLNSGSGGYYAYATQSNTAPGNNIGSAPNQANYYNGAYSVTQSASFDLYSNYLTNVGAFTSSGSYYGTFDQSGNVFEWNDLAGLASTTRGLRGGGWYQGYDLYLSAPYRLDFSDTSGEYDLIGFRLASPVPVPEPSTWAMAAAGLACAGWEAWRRRKRA